MREIGPLGARPTAVSGDGRAVFLSHGTLPQRYRWTVEGGLQEIAPAPTAVSSDASIMSTGDVLWRADGTSVCLGRLEGYDHTQARDISFAGSVVAGMLESDREFTSAPTHVALAAFRWTATGGMVALGYLAGDAHSAVSALSRDGSVVVGLSIRHTTPLLGSAIDTPYRWSSTTGMQSVAAWLATGGVSTVNGINYNGNVVIGSYRRLGSLETHGSLARVGDAGSGFIADPDAFRSGVHEAGMQTPDNANARTALGGDRRATGVALQVHQAF